MGTDYNTTLFRNTFTKKLYGQDQTYENLNPENQEKVNQAIQDRKDNFDPRKQANKKGEV